MTEDKINVLIEDLVSLMKCSYYFVSALYGEYYVNEKPMDEYEYEYDDNDIDTMISIDTNFIIDCVKNIQINCTIVEENRCFCIEGTCCPISCGTIISLSLNKIKKMEDFLKDLPEEHPDSVCFFLLPIKTIKIKDYTEKCRAKTNESSSVIEFPDHHYIWFFSR